MDEAPHFKSVMTLRIGSIRLKFHFLLLILWSISIVTGSGLQFLATFLSLIFHESGHMLMAWKLKIEVTEVEITPHGGLILIDNEDALSPLHAFLLAVSGPLSSFLGCLIAGWLYKMRIFDFSFLESLFRSNLLLLIVNLFPALPLDGGRIISAVLSHYLPWKKASRILNTFGYILGACLCVFSIFYALQGKMIFAPAFSGLYIIYAAAVEKKSSSFRYLSALIGRRNKLDRQDTLAVEGIAVGRSMTLQKLIPKLKSGKNNVIYILSDDGTKLLTTINESVICENILSNNLNAPLSEIIKIEK